MTFDGAVVKEQGITFAIVVVQRHILNSQQSREETRSSFSHYFSRMPIILMAQNSKGIPTYHGRKDIVKFLSNIDHHRIPWKRYSI